MAAARWWSPQLFGDRAFVVGSVIAMVFLAGIPAFFLTFSLYLQIGLGYSALHAGLTTLPFALLSATASGVSIRLAPRLGKRILSVGCVLLVVGMVGLWLTVNAAGTTVSGYQMIPALAVCGLGLGLVVAPLDQHHPRRHPRRGRRAPRQACSPPCSRSAGRSGVAMIGIIFFGQVSGYAPVVAQSSASDAVRAPLEAGFHRRPITDHHGVFRRCFVAQAASADPSAPPPGCPAQAAARTALSGTADHPQRPGSSATSGAPSHLWRRRLWRRTSTTRSGTASSSRWPASGWCS